MAVSYSPVETAATEQNLAEIDEEHVNGKNSSSDSIRITMIRMDVDGDDGGGSKSFLYMATCIANLLALTGGIWLGWTSPELPHLESNATTPLPQPSTASQSAWIGSLLPLGAAVGPFAAGMAADLIGRKTTLLIGCVPFVFAFLAAAYATQVYIFYILRFASGLGVGTVFTVLPMYIGEIADDSVRGSLGSLMQLFVTSGLLMSYSIGPYVSVSLFNMICLIPPIAFLILFYTVVPESPYFLLASEKEKDSMSALMKFRNSQNVRVEMEKMKVAVNETKDNKASIVDIFNTEATTRAMILSLGLVTFQQFSGINIVLFYTYAVTGNSMRPDIATIMVGVMQVVFSFITPIFVERKGKRFLLLTSSIGMTVSLAGLGYYFRLKDFNLSTDSISWLPITCLVLYNATYCAGFGPLPWAIMGELFPANVKSTASTLTAAFCWFLGFLITKYFSMVVDAVGAGVSFYIFSVCCVIATAFVHKLVPETSGKSLQEIQEILEGSARE